MLVYTNKGFVNKRGQEMRLLIFGTGKITKDTLGQIDHLPSQTEIVGFVDNDSKRWGSFMGKTVFSPNELKNIGYDKLIVMPDRYYNDIKENLTYWYQIDAEKIENRYFLLKLLMTDKYKDSEDYDIQKILKYWEKNDISVYHHYIKEEEEYSVVQWDCMENMPFILFEDKRMYFPFDTKFEMRDGKKIVTDILAEQQQSSPHLYIKDDICINQGDVVVDAGVCEGNFILRYIEKISKAYLFEGDQRWIRPLQLTFGKFRDKVVLSDKFLGQWSGCNSVNLDSVINGKVDFLKMDIEGAEPGALLGGRNVLRKNSVKCSICSYHHSGDEMAIKDILQSYGYQTNNSDGYMVFYHDPDIFSSLDFRRGIVYARK